MKQLTHKDYKKILKFYKRKVPKTRKKIKKAAKKILVKKFCSCIQKVQKKTKSKKYSPIGICTKSVIQDKGFKRGKFKCKKRRSIKLHKGGKRRRRTRKKKGKGLWGWFSSNNNKKYQKLPTDNDEINEKILFEQYKNQLIETAKKLEIPTEEFEKWNIQKSPYTKNGKVNLELMKEHVIEAKEALSCMSKPKKGGGNGKERRFIIVKDSPTRKLNELFKNLFRANQRIKAQTNKIKTKPHRGGKRRTRKKKRQRKKKKKR